MHRIQQIVLFCLIMAVSAGLGFSAFKFINPSADGESLRPFFSLEDLQGKTRTAADYDGQWLLLNFWATWCPPCVREMPLLQEWQAKYANVPLKVVGIAVDSPEAVQQFITETGLELTILMANQEGSLLARAYGNQLGGLPFTALVNPAGKIVWQVSGQLNAETDVKKLENLLGINGQNLQNSSQL